MGSAEEEAKQFLTRFRLESGENLVEIPWNHVLSQIQVSVTQRGAQQRGRKQMRANADKRGQTQANAEAKTQANASKREQTWTDANKRLHPPLLQFLHPPLQSP